MTAPILDLNGRWGGKPRQQNIEMVRNDNLTVRVTVLNTDDTPKNLTGATVSWKAAVVAGGNPELTATGTVTDATNGILTVDIPNTNEARDLLYHETEITDSDSAVYTVMTGILRIDRDIL